MIFRRRPPTYSPASDGTLFLWLDATDTATTSLKDTTGAAITNGATVGSWLSKAGTARTFQLFGANARPTWSNSGINGKAAVVFNSQILASNVLTGMTSMSGMTVLVAEQKTGSAPFEPAGCTFGITESHDSVVADSSLVYVAQDPARFVGGRRVQGNSFVSSVVGSTVSNGTPNVQGGVWDWANGKIWYTQNGVMRSRNTNFQTTGTTSANAPFGMAVGAFCQETGTSMGNAMNGKVSEVLVWLSVLTPDQLVAPSYYLRTKYGTPW